MKMSTRGRYGLRLMVELAVRYGQGPVLVDVLARSQDISANYVHLLLAALKTAGLVRATRGPNGGFELARPPSATSALDVVVALEGSVAPVDCITDGTCCARARICSTRDLWVDLAHAVEGVLGTHTLESLARRQQALDSPSHSYEI